MKKQQLTRGWSLDREDPPEKAMTTHSSILAWKISWTEEPGRLESMGHKESDTTEYTHRWAGNEFLHIHSLSNTCLAHSVSWAFLDIGVAIIHFIKTKTLALTELVFIFHSFFYPLKSTPCITSAPALSKAALAKIKNKLPNLNDLQHLTLFSMSSWLW